MNQGGQEGKISCLVKDLSKSESESIFTDSLTVPSLYHGKGKLKISYSGLCRTFSEDIKFDLFNKKWPTFTGTSIDNPFGADITKTSNGISKFFNEISKGWSDEKIKNFFNDAVVAVYAQFCIIYFQSIYSTCKSYRKKFYVIL